MAGTPSDRQSRTNAVFAIASIARLHHAHRNQQWQLIPIADVERGHGEGVDRDERCPDHVPDLFLMCGGATPPPATHSLTLAAMIRND